MTYNWKQVGLAEARSKSKISSRDQFISCIKKQIAWLENGIDYRPEGKRDRRWYHKSRNGTIQCDIRYGAISVLPKGTAIVADSAEDLKAKLKKLVDDTAAGYLDDAIAPAVAIYDAAALSRAAKRK
jgi:hypothetical protein